MALELIYTSSPKGVKPGSSGFFTVACTAGMPPALASFLEGVSGYKPAFPASDSRAKDSPVAFQFVRYERNGLYAVLGRIGHAGLDYTGRSNKIAHHLVLADDEFAAAGPAGVLLDLDSGNRLLGEWNGDPDPGRLPVKVPRPAASTSCRAACWNAAAGDAGWAGVLAQAYLDAPEVPAYIIYRLGDNPLTLIHETLQLLPEPKRWDVTFNTYFTSLPRGVTCAWRCVLEGTQPAREATIRKGLTVIDLTKSLGAAPDGAFTDAARSGEIPNAAWAPYLPAAVHDVAEAVAPETLMPTAGATVRPGTVRPVAAVRLGSPSSSLIGGKAPAGSRTGSPRRREKAGRRGLHVLFAVLLLVILGGGLVFMVQRGKMPQGGEILEVALQLPPPTLSTDHTKIVFNFPVAAGSLDFAEYPINKKKFSLRGNDGEFKALDDASCKDILLVASGNGSLLAVVFANPLKGSDNRLRIAPGTIKLANGGPVAAELTSLPIDASADIEPPTFEIFLERDGDRVLSIILSASESIGDVKPGLAELSVKKAGESESTAIPFEHTLIDNRIEITAVLPEHSPADIVEFKIPEKFARDAADNLSIETSLASPIEQITLKPAVPVAGVTDDDGKSEPSPTDTEPPKETVETPDKEFIRGVWVAWHQAVQKEDAWNDFVVSYDGLKDTDTIQLIVTNQEHIKKRFVKEPTKTGDQTSRGVLDGAGEDANIEGEVVDKAIVKGVNLVDKDINPILGKCYVLEDKYRIVPQKGRYHIAKRDDTGNELRDIVRPSDISSLVINKHKLPALTPSKATATELELGDDLSATVKCTGTAIEVTVTLSDIDTIFLDGEVPIIVSNAAKGKWKCRRENEFWWILSAQPDYLFPDDLKTFNAERAQDEKNFKEDVEKRLNEIKNTYRDKVENLKVGLEPDGYKKFSLDVLEKTIADFPEVGNNDNKNYINRLRKEESWEKLAEELKTRMPREFKTKDSDVQKLWKLATWAGEMMSRESQIEEEKLRLPSRKQKFYTDRWKELPDTRLQEEFPKWGLALNIKGCYQRKLVLKTP